MTDENTFGSDRNGRECDAKSSRRSVLRGASALAVTVGFGSVEPVAADHKSGDQGDDGPISDFATSASDGLSKFRGVVSGRWSRWRSETSSTKSSTLAADTATVFNEHSTTLVDYANKHVAGDREKTGLDTIRLEFTKSGETATRWIVASVADGDFVSADMVDADPGRAVDHYVELHDLAADNAADELDYFVDEYAKSGEKYGAGYEGRLGGKYREDVDSSLIK